MPPIVAAAAITGLAQATTAVVGAKSQSASNKRATQAQERAAQRAEAFEREQAAREDADQARIEAEERRRWDTEQANLAAERTERDKRQAYEDKIRYGKMLRLAELTGGPRPEPMPNFSGSMPLGALTNAPPGIIQTGAPILSRPSTANAMIPPPAAFDPFAAPAQGVPLAALSRRRTM